MRKNWSIVLCAAWLGAAVVASAQAAEPKCQCPAAAGHEAGVQLLSKVPYLSRLFKNVAPASDDQAWERIGIDFDFGCPDSAGQPACFEFRVHPAGAVEARCVGEGPECHKGICRLVACEEAAACGEKCAACGEKCTASCAAKCAANCAANCASQCAAKCAACTDCKCSAEGCCKTCSQTKECICSAKHISAGECAGKACCAGKECCAGNECCCAKGGGKSDACGCQVAVARCPCTGALGEVVKLSHGACSCKQDVALWERIVELTADKAAAEAAVAAHEETAELTDSLVELVAENASLAAKVEAQERQHEAFEQLVALVKENAELKAKVELAAAQTELLKQTIQVAVENERLKLRIAHLEGHHGNEPAHTAAKPEQQPTR